jgi:Na+-transporting methylmalonyl-CoA/oxaloacetate decarboxylase gamma subunit
MIKFLVILILLIIILRRFGRFVIITNVNPNQPDPKAERRRQQEEMKKQEGRVTIQKLDNNKKNEGDFVDFEEVK